MKKILLLSLLPVLLLALIVALIIPRGGGKGADKAMEIGLSHGGKVLRVSLAEYLCGVVAGEMPASFEPEALKAQAVAARTYAFYRMERGAHEGFDLCGEAACCAAYADEAELRARWGKSYAEYAEKIRKAVGATDGEYLAYDGGPILAVFHSSSCGRTEDSGEVWLQSLPYLASVSTPESEGGVPNLFSTLRMTAQELKGRLLPACQGAELPENPRSWLSQVFYTAGGRVRSLRFGGVELSGSRFRLLLGLRSTAFGFSVEGGEFVFSTRGYGHGVGLSQYGAEAMAAAGETYQAILAHYYTGAQLVKK